MNNLEKFIKTNREDFDIKEPRTKLWARIETDLDGKTDYGWMWKAAVVVLLAVSGYLIFERSQGQSTESMVASEFFLDPEFMETELYYTQLIAQKSLVIAEYNLKEEADIKTGFKNDIAVLDTMYQELKQEFIDTSNEIVLDAMIHNLQLRMEMLNQELMILETIEKHHDEKTNETQYL